MEWLIVEGLLAKSVFCPQCNKEMKLVTCNDRWDGLKWECRIQTSGKWHKTETSIRKGSWFSQSNMTLEETLKCMYWWCQDLEQSQIMHELGLVHGTGVDWDRFCREVCEMTMFGSSQKIGEEGKIVQIDESKLSRDQPYTGRRTFKYRLSRARIQVERGLGQHKGRCQCLHKQRDCDPDKVVLHIMTACILHNMWEERKECYLEEWNSLSESEIDDLQEFA